MGVNCVDQEIEVVRCNIGGVVKHLGRTVLYFDARGVVSNR